MLRKGTGRSGRLAASLALLSLAVLCGAPVAADEIDVNAGSDALRLGYVRALRDGGLQVDFSYLNEDRADIGAVGVHVVDLALKSNAWRVGLGASCSTSTWTPTTGWPWVWVATSVIAGPEALRSSSEARSTERRARRRSVAPTTFWKPTCAWPTT